MKNLMSRRITARFIVCMIALSLSGAAVAGHRARLLNQTAVDHILKVWPHLRQGLEQSVPNVENVGQRVVMTTSPPWSHFKTAAEGSEPTPYQLSQGFKKLAQEQLLPAGITQFESRLDTSGEATAMYMLLRDDGRLPVRFAWHYEQHRQPIFSDDHIREFYTDRGATWAPMEDSSPWLWLGGVGSEGDGDTVNGGCITVGNYGTYTDPQMEDCPDPSSSTTDAVLNGAIQAGWRMVGLHGVGPGMINVLVQQFQKAQKVNPDLTLARIRKMRNTFAHGTMLGHDPRMLALAKKYNFTLVVNVQRSFHDEPGFVDKYIVDPDGTRGDKDFWLAPVKSVLDAGVHLANEYGGFGGLQTVVTRTDLDTGKVYGPQEAVDRVVALKLVTLGSAFALFSDSLTGSLEPGKYADFAVLDKDYLSGPDDEIRNNKFIMTVVNGKVGYQDPNFKVK